ncbi:hypothetical protein ACREZ2_11430, partial [Streptococcus pneumoniae]
RSEHQKRKDEICPFSSLAFLQPTTVDKEPNKLRYFCFCFILLFLYLNDEFVYGKIVVGNEVIICSNKKN